MAYIDSANIKGTLYDIHDTAARDMIAPSYSTASAYAVGDYVTYNDKLYRCAVAIASGEAWTAAHWMAVDVGGEVGDLKSQTTALETYVRDMSPVATVGPADMVSVDDAAPLTVEGLVVDVEPAQDLHGYDAPWPAGGGVNQFDPSDATPVQIGRSYGLTVAVDESQETISINGAPTWSASGGTFNFAIVDVTKDYSGKALTRFVISKSSNISSINNIAYSNGTITINVTATNNSTVSITVKLVIAVSSVSTFSPYSNICPITGWTGAEVYRTGKNLFDGMIQQGQINSQGENTLSNTRIRCVGYIPVKPNMVYTLSRSVSTSALTVRMYDAKKEFLGVGGSQYFTIIPDKGYSSAQPMIAGYTICSFTFGDGVAYFRFQDQSNDLTAKYQLELGSTATDYEPYQGDTFDITFPSEAGTVYGGMVDLTLGKLVVDRGYIASYAGETLPGAWISSMDVYAPGTTPTTGAQVVYTLASTAEYDLTPQEITMFKGMNNLWANTGDISVQYRQDVYTALNNKINALEALVLENMN